MLLCLWSRLCGPQIWKYDNSVTFWHSFYFWVSWEIEMCAVPSHLMGRFPWDSHRNPIPMDKSADKCKFESSQKNESRAKQADSSQAGHESTASFVIANMLNQTCKSYFQNCWRFYLKKRFYPSITSMLLKHLRKTSLFVFFYIWLFFTRTAVTTYFWLWKGRICENECISLKIYLLL